MDDLFNFVIEYCPDGEAFSDFNLEEQVKLTLRNSIIYGSGEAQKKIKVSTENFIYQVKLMVAKEELRCTQVTFLFNGMEIHPNRFGAFINHDIPDGFADKIGSIASDIIHFAHKMLLKERNNLCLHTSQK